MSQNTCVAVELLNLHTRPERAVLFANPAAHFGWDEKLGVYATLTPEASRAAFASTDWHALEFSKMYEALTERLEVPFEHSIQALYSLPLSAEGERHTASRNTLAVHLSAQTKVLNDRIDGIVDTLLAPCSQGGNFELMTDVVVPLVDQVNEILCGVPSPGTDVSVSRIFDSLIGIRNRQKLEEGLSIIHDEAARLFQNDQTAIDRAMVLHILGADSLAGTIGESLAHVLEKSEGKKLSDIDFEPTFTATSVPYIERRAINGTTLCGRHFEAGSRLRVYLLPHLYAEDGADPMGIFGYGRHVCLGKRISNLVWTALIAKLAHSDRVLQHVTYTTRKSDYIFTFPEAINVRLA